MRHSRRTPRASRNVTHADAYAPNSPAYAERHEAHEAEGIPSLPGLVRVDVGAPVPK